MLHVEGLLPTLALSVAACFASGAQAEDILVFDVESERFYFVPTVANAKYLTVDQLSEYRQSRAERELAGIDKACSLSAGQNQSLKAAFALHDSMLVRAAKELAFEMTINPPKGFSARARDLTLRFQKSYLANGSLSSKVLEGRLDEHQKQLLHENYISDCINKFILRLKLNNNQSDELSRFINDLVKSKSGFVSDPHFYLDLLVTADQNRLVEILGEQQLKRIHEVNKNSNGIDEFLRNLNLSGLSMNPFNSEAR